MSASAEAPLKHPAASYNHEGGLRQIETWSHPAWQRLSGHLLAATRENRWQPEGLRSLGAPA